MTLPLRNSDWPEFLQREPWVQNQIERGVSPADWVVLFGSNPVLQSGLMGVTEPAAKEHWITVVAYLIKTFSARDVAELLYAAIPTVKLRPLGLRESEAEPPRRQDP